MPRRKTRHSRPVRRAARDFRKFADRLASMIAVEVKAALKVAVAEAERVEAAEVEPVVEANHVKVRRRRRRRAAVVPQASAPRATRNRGRPPKNNLLASREPTDSPVDLPSDHLATESAAAEESVDTPVVVKVIPPKRRRLRCFRPSPVQVKADTAPQVLRRPVLLPTVKTVTPLEIAGEAAEGAAQAREPDEVAVKPEPVETASPEEPEPFTAPTVTKPLDRMTRMRTSFRPGKIAHVADDADVPAPAEEQPSAE